MFDVACFLLLNFLFATCFFTWIKMRNNRRIFNRKRAKSIYIYIFSQIHNLREKEILANQPGSVGKAKEVMDLLIINK